MYPPIGVFRSQLSDYSNSRPFTVGLGTEWSASFHHGSFLDLFVSKRALAQRTTLFLPNNFAAGTTLSHMVCCKFHGHSLNNALLTGPDLLQSFIHILFRFCQFPKTVSADIEGMFLQVGDIPKDQPFIRFL